MRKKDNEKWKPWRGNPNGREFRGHNENENQKNAKASTLQSQAQLEKTKQ